MQVYCDFDGTITLEDVTDCILEHCADPEWEAIEEEWKQGFIGSGECMRRQIGLIQANQNELNTVLDQISIDPAFPDFVDFCQDNKIPLTIVSDGVDYFINRILTRFNITDLPILANHLTITENGYELLSPYSSDSCECFAGVCKCKIIETPDPCRVYIGDGRSDFCAVTKRPELVFAKGNLIKFCQETNIPYQAFNHFDAVTDTLALRLAQCPETKTLNLRKVQL